MLSKKSGLQLPQSPEQVVRKECEDFLAALSEPQRWQQIPLLNYTPLEALQDMSIVRFRGMVQDMHDPEIYLERYEVRHTHDPSRTRIQEGKYRDCWVLHDGEEVDHDAAANSPGERRTLFVVSIPGINAWTAEYEAHCNRPNIPKSTAVSGVGAAGGDASTAKKRAAPDDELMDCADDAPSGSRVATGQNGQPASDSSKRLCLQQHETHTGNSTMSLGVDYLLNSPIPERPGKACMVKIYDDFAAYALNSIIDVVGFLSVNPALDATIMDVEMCTAFDNINELQAHNPPPSLIPRLHALAVHTLPHNNPLLDERFLHVVEAHAATATAVEEELNMLAVHKDLRTLLGLCVFNDELAVDYLLCHLISTVYSRCDMKTIGKFPLNICQIPEAVVDVYPKHLYEILEMLIPASHYQPMTLEAMNTADFAPRKDYRTSRLLSGLLQLAPHTHLVLDETRMQQGKLEASGVRAVQNIAHLIKNQQIKGNFEFYEIEYNTDIPVLVLSEGRSMLTLDFLLPLQTDKESIKLVPATFEAARHFLQPKRLEQIRRFLTKAKICKFNMSPKESDMIQTDYVEMRRANTIANADDLHTLLVLSRLLAIARGKDVLDKDSWELAKELEAKRKQRVQQLPKSSRLVSATNRH